MDSLLLHATTVSLNGLAVVIRGKSGSGKSDLALQLLEGHGRGLCAEPISALLVSDDQTLLARRGDRVFASAPHQIDGLLEIRGQGIIRVASAGECEVALIVDLADAEDIERMPDASALETNLLGVPLSRIIVDAARASAAARIRVAFSHRNKLQQGPLAVDRTTS